MTHQPYHLKLSESPHFPHLKEKEDGAAEVTQQLIAHVALAKDLGSSLSIHMVVQNHP